ncbi:MAG: histidinol dehydrogenase [Rickettsiales bacterium]|nr:histidinol dehydrogenase [Rickettsiales bacterium]
MQIFLIKENLTENLSESVKSGFYKFIIKSQKTNSAIDLQVKKIIAQTKKSGDSALIKLSNQFDKTNFKQAKDFIVSASEIDEAEKQVNSEVKAALKHAFQRIESYHKKQLPKNFCYHDEDGVELGNLWRPIAAVGIYTPGGSASYPSSVLMSAIPALVAGVKNISMCVPTNSGSINPAVIFAAKICGIKKIYKIGGAQAIAAFAYGTKTISKVDKIVGPGNSFVAGAKKNLYGEVGIDMIAGPTDITIIADKNNNPEWIAIDALSQLEHGIDSKAFIIVDDENFAKKISAAIKQIKTKLSRRKIIEQSLKNSAIFIVKNLNDSFHLANFIAPEHLEIVAKNAPEFTKKINNAGAIFLGNYTPEAIGDYIAGPSHTLPTSRSAKFSSGLSVYDFLKRISLISCNEKSFKNLAQSASTLAACEGLSAHQLSIDIRR